MTVGLDVLVASQGALAGDEVENWYGGTVGVRGAGPRLIVNFAGTLDGVVALGGQDAATSVSGGNPDDRMLMALLRAEADVVLVGAGTLRDTPRHLWTASHLVPGWSEHWQAHRARLGAAGNEPALVVVSGNGDVPASHPAIAAPSSGLTILTSARGAERLDVPTAEIAVIADQPPLGGAAIRRWIESSLTPAVTLCEGGPRLLGSLMADSLVDDLFLTLVPRIAGRVDESRDGLVMGWAATAQAMPAASLRSLRRAGDVLFTHYRFGDGGALQRSR